MSWCGGGEISVTPGVAHRTFAIRSSTLCPGSCPPSPGLAPCAILICSSVAFTRYSALTPKRPDATWWIAERRRSPASSRTYRRGSSPPSPLLDFPPMRFIATAKVSCASAEIDPKDIAPVAKRLTISVAGSTSARGTPPSGAHLNSSSPRSVDRDASSLTSCEYSSHVVASSDRVAACSFAMVAGFHRCSSPRRRHW